MAKLFGGYKFIFLCESHSHKFSKCPGWVRYELCWYFSFHYLEQIFLWIYMLKFFSWLLGQKCIHTIAVAFIHDSVLVLTWFVTSCVTLFTAQWQQSKTTMNVPVTILSQLFPFFRFTREKKHFKDIKFLLCFFKSSDSCWKVVECENVCAAKRNLLWMAFLWWNYFSCCCILYGSFLWVSWNSFGVEFLML